MQIRIKKIKGGKLPEYKTEGSAGADCYARIEKEIVIAPGKSETIPLGFAVEIPAGYEIQIRGRSGLARKNNIDCFLGTIDSDYRGEVCVIIINKGSDYFKVRPFDRIAQAVIAQVSHAEWEVTDNLSETERGENGFGSTGISEVKVDYPHKVEKFYEPFKSIEKAEKYLGKEVLLDGKETLIVKSVSANNLSIMIQFENRDRTDFYNLYALMAFERVVVDGHRFGQEMKFEG